jgi:antitoxin component YwqK of YwqJK toxin-antitoxin module
MDITHLLDQHNNPPKRCEPNADGCIPDGQCVAYRKDGAVLLEITYERGVAQGPYRDYWPDGKVACEGQYAGGLQEGEWRFYHRDRPPETIRFVAGRQVIDWDAFFARARSDA